MVPYYLLLALPIIPYCVFPYEEQRERRNKAIVTVFFVMLTAMLMFRDLSVGTDNENYIQFFKKLSMLESQGIERGFVALNHLLRYFTSDYQVLVMVIALLSMLPLLYFYRKESEIPYLSIVLFMTIAPFSMYFSALRQVLAMTFGIPAFYCVKNKKLLWFLVLVGLASLFHRSALIMVMMYPVYHLKINSKRALFLAPVFGFVFAAKGRIFSLLLRFVGNQYSELDGSSELSGGYTVLLLLVIFAVYCFYIPDEEALEEDVCGLRNILLLSVLLQCFAPLHTLAMRMNYYFLQFLPILIPKIAVRSSENNKQLSRLSVWVMCLFFAAWFIYSAKTGEDLMMIFPYVTYWSK